MRELQSNGAGYRADTSLRQIASHEERSEQDPDIHTLPKNRSTGDLLAKTGDHKNLRVSFDAATVAGLGSAPRSPLIPEHEHGLGLSGLRRIRQQPPSRAPSQPASPSTSYSLPPRSSSMTSGLTSSPGFTRTGLSSPTLNFTEDLSRFPSESLHSFSFAHQSEDAFHNRQNVLKRTLEFVRDRLGFGFQHPGIVTAQAKISGDTEVQNMVDLLVRANIIGNEDRDRQSSRHLHGPLTGPADIEKNVFECAFVPHQKSPEDLKDHPPVEGHAQHAAEIESSRPGSSQPEPSLNSEASASDPAQTQTPFSGSPGLQPRRLSTERNGLKRTFTDLSLLHLQTKLAEALATPYKAGEHSQDSLTSRTPTVGAGTGINTPSYGNHIHGHHSRWVPAAQAVFNTEASSPYTILAANDLACLVFGVTKGELKKLSMLEIVREGKRAWLEDKLRSPGSNASTPQRSKSARTSPKSSSSLNLRGGVTAQLLSKPSWRQQRAQTEDLSKKSAKSETKPSADKPRGVLLCGDIVPIQKRNGATGAASLWVKEKHGVLIWVLEEIAEDIAILTLDAELHVIHAKGATEIIWGKTEIPCETDVQHLIPHITKKQGSSIMDKLGLQNKGAVQRCTTMSDNGVRIPVSITMEPDGKSLRVSSIPHIAGIIVISASNLRVISSNSVFSAALFGQADLDGQEISELIPQFKDILDILTEVDNISLVHGIVVPEQRFRTALDQLDLRVGNTNAASIFLRQSGLVARHRDGSHINIDMSMRVVRSQRISTVGSVIEERSEDSDATSDSLEDESEIVYALWITYSRRLHSPLLPIGSATPNLPEHNTPYQPSPGQADRAISPQLIEPDDSKLVAPAPTSLSQQIKEAASQPISQNPPKPAKAERITITTKARDLVRRKKKITEFTIIQEMGQGAYGQVKLSRYSNGKKVVLKYVTKKRILVDTWIRDRKLGTVPLEIHVLDYLRKEELRHPNIVEMIDFFEDDVNYYIEMVPHGLPGLDLFDYIEQQTHMDEAECRNIFVQVVNALHHLHTKALVVHRDIKDENIILDTEGKVKLIDFGSAAYIKNGPFNVFVGTIDYAAPEVLAGNSYRGKEQDIWALGILLYTLVYKENPFYNIDEILDHELRIPWIMSEPSINLIQAMLNRAVDQRLTITQVKEHPWCSGADRAHDN